MSVKWSKDKPHCSGLWLGWHTNGWEVSILKATEGRMDVIGYPLNHQIHLGLKTVLSLHYYSSADSPTDPDRTPADVDDFSYFSCINSPVSDDNVKRDRRKHRAL